MKYLVLFLLSFSIISCSNITETEYKISDELAYLKIGTDITKSELTAIAEKFKEQKNIDVNFSKCTFDEDGKMKKLSLKVDCNDGSSGSTSASPLGTRVGFIRNYQSGASNNFSIGVVD